MALRWAIVVLWATCYRSHIFRYHSQGTVSPMGYLRPEKIVTHFIIFDENTFGVLWIGLCSFGLYSRVHESLDARWWLLWTASSKFGTYRLCEQRRFGRACTSAQSRQNLRCSLICSVSQEEPSDRKPDPWPLWMAGHAQLKFVMTECSKTQIRLTGLIMIIIDIFVVYITPVQYTYHGWVMTFEILFGHFWRNL